MMVALLVVTSPAPDDVGYVGAYDVGSGAGAEAQAAEHDSSLFVNTYSWEFWWEIRYG